MRKSVLGIAAGLVLTLGGVAVLSGPASADVAPFPPAQTWQQPAYSGSLFNGKPQAIGSDYPVAKQGSASSSDYPTATPVAGGYDHPLGPVGGVVGSDHPAPKQGSSSASDYPTAPNSTFGSDQPGH